MGAQLGLAHRISSLRERLEEIVPEKRTDSSSFPHFLQLQSVVNEVSQIQERSSEMDESLRQVEPDVATVEVRVPKELTWRARRLLLDAKEQVDQLRRIERDSSGEAADHPLLPTFRQTLTMCEMAIRAIQTCPYAGADQLRLCDGVESILNLARERTMGMKHLAAKRAAERDRIESLGCMLLALAHGRPIVWKSLQDMADMIVDENEEPFRLRMALPGDARPEQRAAAHSLLVARIMARISRLDGEWRGRRRDAVLAALVFDAGMAAMPAEAMNHPEPLTDEQRRQIEAHVGLSAEGVKHHVPAEGWLVDVVRAHHERMDGTGYPTGANGPRIPRLARLLAVCDVYAALCSPRPYRAAMTPRAALTETLLEAEKGRLDPAIAEYLLDLSFYPVGTVVEMSDGQTGVVVAVNRMAGDLDAPARPVVQVLLNEAGEPLPWPNHVNLAESQGRHIVRSLTADECRTNLGPKHWHFL